MHSTGAGFVDRKSDKFTLVKRVGHPFNLLQDKEYHAALEDKESSKVLMGHNRYATFGEKTEKNAHPFAFSHVMGMHNGTLDKWTLRDLKDVHKYDTDSEAIFATMNATSAQNTLSLMTGAWALVWFDKRDHTLNMLRNDRRPLHYCYSEDHCTLIWASEVDMLRYAMARKGKKVDKGEDGFYVCQKDMHYSWHVPKDAFKKFDPPEQVELKGKSYSYTGSFTHGSANTHTGATRTLKYGSNSHSLTLYDNIIPFAKRLNTNKFRPPYKDMYGHVVNKNQFTRLTKEGCCFCNQNGQEWGEFIHLMSAYVGNHTPYTCEACFNDTDLYDYTQYAI